MDGNKVECESVDNEHHDDNGDGEGEGYGNGDDFQESDDAEAGAPEDPEDSENVLDGVGDPNHDPWKSADVYAPETSFLATRGDFSEYLALLSIIGLHLNPVLRAYVKL